MSPAVIEECSEHALLRAQNVAKYRVTLRCMRIVPERYGERDKSRLRRACHRRGMTSDAALKARRSLSKGAQFSERKPRCEIVEFCTGDGRTDYCLA